MSTFSGVGVTPGRLIAPTRRMPDPIAAPAVGESRGEGASAEDAFAELKAAAQAVNAELRQRAERATGDGKAVLEATALMATDSMLLKEAKKRIDAGASTQRAMWEAGDVMATMLANLGGYMAERVNDVEDVRARIVAALRGVPAPGIPEAAEPFILIAHDLAPADTATLDPSKVLALLTEGGGPQSHTAIIARNLGLPAVVAIKGVTSIQDGTQLFIDAAKGVISTEITSVERELAAGWAVSSQSLATFDGDNRLADGTAVPLLANVGNAHDAQKAAAAGAQGVGLFRTEFLFLDRSTEPTPQEQEDSYRAVFDAFPGKKVVVRTLDAGADKPLPFLGTEEESNPALGVRGYRTDAVAPGILGRQLAAIARAAAASSADVWVMAPMVSTATEAASFAALVADAGLPTAGVMIEVPSAAVTARKLLAHVSFASLGTNDLTQYTMAADRQLASLAALNDPWQPAVLSLVSATVQGTEAHGGTSVKNIGVCGEAAADPALAVVLVGLGVTTLSMSARALPGVAAVLRTVTMADAQKLAALALDAEDAISARAVVRKQLPVLESLGL